MDHPALRRTESQLSGSRGHVLFRRAWLPDEPERVLLLVHGLCEHSGRYDHVGAWFAARDCAVHAYDHQGHGRSSGPRCHARRFRDLVDDLELFLERVRGEHPRLPIFLVGHSMGGLVVTSFVRERSPDVVGAVTCGAVLAPPVGVKGLQLWLLAGLRRLAPRLRVWSVDPAALSRDPEVGRAYAADPLVQRRVSAGLAAEMLETARRTQSQASLVHTPMLLLHGEDDPLCPVQASRAFYAELAAADSALRTYPRLRHELFNEPERETVFEDVLEWVRARTR